MEKEQSYHSYLHYIKDQLKHSMDILRRKYKEEVFKGNLSKVREPRSPEHAVITKVPTYLQGILNLTFEVLNLSLSAMRIRFTLGKKKSPICIFQTERFEWNDLLWFLLVLLIWVFADFWNFRCCLSVKCKHWARRHLASIHPGNSYVCQQQLHMYKLRNV